PFSTSTCGFVKKDSIWTNSPSRPPRALLRRKNSSLACGGPLLAALVLTLTAVVPATASQADDYTNAIHRALTLVQFAERGDTPSIGQALQVLATAPGPSQPEILHDLGLEPPNLTDADQRLQALYTALQARVDTPDPDRAHQQLNQVLSMPRSGRLASGPA